VVEVVETTTVDVVLALSTTVDPVTEETGGVANAEEHAGTKRARIEARISGRLGVRVIVLLRETIPPSG
jgi:hypothetical protein